MSAAFTSVRAIDGNQMSYEWKGTAYAVAKE